MSLKQSDVIRLFKCVHVQTNICLVIVIFAIQQNKKTKIKHIQHQLKLRNFVTAFCSFILKKKSTNFASCNCKKTFWRKIRASPVTVLLLFTEKTFVVLLEKNRQTPTSFLSVFFFDDFGFSREEILCSRVCQPCWN